MKSTTSLSILFLILVLSMFSGTLLYFYMDPERNLPVAYAMMGTALYLMSASFITIVLYIFKRVYYRGAVSMTTMQSSVRQGFLFACGLIGIVVFNRLGILAWRTGGLLFFILFLFELMIQSLSASD